MKKKLGSTYVIKITDFNFCYNFVLIKVKFISNLPVDEYFMMKLTNILRKQIRLYFLKKEWSICTVIKITSLFLIDFIEGYYNY